MKQLIVWIVIACLLLSGCGAPQKTQAVESQSGITFTDDLGADSLDIFQIIMGLEEEFDIEIAPEKAENVKTVEEALELIKGEL